jgi:hypothetical protein
MPAGCFPLCAVELMFPQQINISMRLHDQDLAGHLLEAQPGNWEPLHIDVAPEWIPELEYLNYEGETAPLALRALARRRYEMRMERKAVRTERYHRRMARLND